ncbi:MAG: tRNA (adenosine(37)-N6)-threonylcarbamoyltransferase complex dimerization subunit type 1 TsaB [Nitrospirales bacterium]
MLGHNDKSLEKMLILAVETATSQQSVAILQDSQVLGSRSRDAEGSHTRWLIPTIDELLTSLSLDMDKVSGLAVSIGPGSFTGLRAGLATMLGFRLAFTLPLVTVPTLEAMAWNFRPSHEVICPMLKARVGEVYWACFRWEGDTLIRITDDQAGSLATLIESLEAPTWVFGEGWAVNQDKLEGKSHLLKPVLSRLQPTSADSVGFASLQRFRSGDVASFGIAPHYVLPCHAELVKNKQKTL